MPAHYDPGTLNVEQLAVAMRLNPYFHRKLLVQDRSLGDPSTPGYAFAVAEIQSSLDLHVDGVLGPKTHAMMSGAKMAGVVDYLTVDGKRVGVPFPVVDWTEPGGMSFYDHPSTWRSRSKRPDLFVLHWDVCRSSQACYQALIGRGLSIHLMVDGDENAIVYQCLDLATAIAWHASSAEVDGPENTRSVGVEINNPVILDSHDRPVAVSQPKAHSGETWSHYDFTDVQKTRIVELCDAVCSALGLWRSIPVGNNVVSYAPAGVCGHYHLKSAKVDPGMTLWPVLEKAGYAREKRVSRW